MPELNPSITARNYTDHDLPRLQTTLASWIQEAGDCGYCHAQEITRRIYTPMADSLPVAETVQVWEDDSGIIGIALNLRFDNAFEVYTSPAYRGTAAERIMLGSATETTRRLMRQVGREATSVIIDVWDCDTTRQQLLGAIDFAQYRIWGHLTERSLAEPIPPPRLADGFTLRAATMSDAEQLAAVRNASFGTDFKPQDYRDGVMHKPGYDPAREIVVVAPDGRFAAFTMIWLDSVNKVGLFEPVGTHQEFRRKGLARGLMLHALYEMQRLSMTTATVGYDATNAPAAALYQSLGFNHQYTTLGYKRVVHHILMR
jgi:GNAT superfamily N-acetyltransferase